MEIKNLITSIAIVIMATGQAQLSLAQTANKSSSGWTLLDKNAQAQLSLAQVSDKSLEGWSLLGSRTVDYTLDRDVVSLKQTTGNFTALKFIVKHGAINIHNRIVHFADGDMNDLAFSEEAKTNNCLLLDLKGSNSVMEKVTFWYDAKNSTNHKSIVELWGKI